MCISNSAKEHFLQVLCASQFAAYINVMTVDVSGTNHHRKFHTAFLL